jgi:hypothetical protein
MLAAASAATRVSSTTQHIGQPPGHRPNAHSYIMSLHELEMSDVTQAVNRQLSLLNAREIYVGFMADKLTVELFLSEYFRWTVYTHNSTDVSHIGGGSGPVCDCSCVRNWFSSKTKA